MDAQEFCARLLAVAGKHDLTASDLAIWFARPRVTVRTWMADEHRPDAARGAFKECARRLDMLERSSDFPVPYEVLKHGRRAYIQKAFINATNEGVSGSGASTGRAVLSRSARSGDKVEAPRVPRHLRKTRATDKILGR
jgi:hypothetical protein